MIVQLTESERSSVVKSYDQIYEIMRRVLTLGNGGGIKRDHLWVIGFKELEYIKFIEMVTFGPWNSRNISPRKVFQLAVSLDCPRILVVSNLPKGEPTVSKEHIAVLSRLISAGELMDLDVMDQLLITPEDGYVSIMYRKGESPFKKDDGKKKK